MSSMKIDPVKTGINQHYVRDYMDASISALRQAAEASFIDSVCHVADIMVRCVRSGGKLMFAGNGGSAGDAQHIAGEFVSRLNFDRPPIAAIALTVDTSVLTAIGNDYGFEQVFLRQVRALARPADVLVGISTSGQSPNVCLALRAARELGVVTVGLGGAGDTPMSALCDAMIRVPSRSTPMIQQVYMVAAHALCGLVEKTLFEDNGDVRVPGDLRA